MASGDTLFVFTAYGPGTPPDANYATFDTRAGAANTQNAVLDFDDTTDESYDFVGFMPANYDGGGLTVTLIWGATTATTGTVSWDVSFKSISDDADDIDTKAYAAANNSGAVTTASATGEFGFDNITFTDGADMDSVAANEPFFMRVTRDADGTTATDSMSGDAELLMAVVKET